MIRFPNLTLLAYRASHCVTSLGSLQEEFPSQFSFFQFGGIETKELEARALGIMVADTRARRQNAQYPFHMFIVLVDGQLPRGDTKHDMDCLLLRAAEEASSIVADEERAANLERLQAERSRRERDSRFEKDRDFATLKTLMGKYSLEELRSAGVLEHE